MNMSLEELTHSIYGRRYLSELIRVHIFDILWVNNAIICIFPSCLPVDLMKPDFSWIYPKGGGV